LNAIYANGPGTNQVPYWFFPDGKELLSNPAPDGILNGHHDDSVFSGQSKQALWVIYTPDSTKCLHILRPGDVAYRDYPDALRLAAKSASLDAILTDARSNFALLDTITGPENSNSWCYYYQKADLAVQKKDWQAVASLWAQATQKNLAPTDGLELLPFTEAFLQRKEWDSAFTLTRSANKMTRNAADVYCPLWASPGSEQPVSAGWEPILFKTRNLLACP